MREKYNLKEKSPPKEKKKSLMGAITSTVTKGDDKDKSPNQDKQRRATEPAPTSNVKADSAQGKEKWYKKLFKQSTEFYYYNHEISGTG